MTIRPYVDPELPKNAPAWARTWCSGEREPILRSHYDKNVALYSAAAAHGMEHRALDMLTRFPAWALCHLSCDTGPTCECSGLGLYVSIRSVALSVKDAEDVVGVCRNADRCSTPADEHPLVLPRGLTVLGYHRGVTPDLMRAIYDGASYEEVRAMALDRRSLH